MDITKAIAELRNELTLIDEAMQVLSRIASGEKRRGRPPKWLAASIQSEEAAAEPRRGMSAAARAAQSERMKKRWAAKRKAAVK